MAEFLTKATGSIKDLPEVKGEEASLPCYFTPHYFGADTKEGTVLSTQPLTLRQIMALLDEKGYNVSKLYYSEEPIKLVEKRKAQREKKTGEK